MKYTTDFKWKPLREDMNGYGFRYRGIPYELNEFTTLHGLSRFESFSNCPIKVHGIYAGSAFHVVMIEIDESNEMYRVCTLTDCIGL